MTEIETKNNLDKTTRMYKLSWLFVDKWFRILEFSLILAALYYFDQVIKTNIPLKMVYYLSWVLLWGWFQDASVLVAEKISYHKKLSKNKRAVVWVLCTIFVMALYLLITSATNAMIARQYM